MSKIQIVTLFEPLPLPDTRYEPTKRAIILVMSSITRLLTNRVLTLSYRAPTTGTYLLVQNLEGYQLTLTRQSRRETEPLTLNRVPRTTPVRSTGPLSSEPCASQLPLPYQRTSFRGSMAEPEETDLSATARTLQYLHCT